MATATAKKRVKRDPNEPTGPQRGLLETLRGGKVRIRYYPATQQPGEPKRPIIEPLPDAVDSMLGMVVKTCRRATLQAMVRKKLLTFERVQLTKNLSCEQWSLRA